MGFLDKAKQAAQDAKKEGGLLDKAKQAANQAQAKIDEKQKAFNDKQAQDAQSRAAQPGQAPPPPPPPQGDSPQQTPPPPPPQAEPAPDTPPPPPPSGGKPS